MGGACPRQYHKEVIEMAKKVEGLQPGDWVITTGYDTFGDAEELILK